MFTARGFGELARPTYVAGVVQDMVVWILPFMVGVCCRGDEVCAGRA
jgi:hypothetical protein